MFGLNFMKFFKEEQNEKDIKAAKNNNRMLLTSSFMPGMGAEEDEEIVVNDNLDEIKEEVDEDVLDVEMIKMEAKYIELSTANKALFEKTKENDICIKNYRETLSLLKSQHIQIKNQIDLSKDLFPKEITKNMNWAKNYFAVIKPKIEEIVNATNECKSLLTGQIEHLQHSYKKLFESLMDDDMDPKQKNAGIDKIRNIMKDLTKYSEDAESFKVIFEIKNEEVEEDFSSLKQVVEDCFKKVSKIRKENSKKQNPTASKEQAMEEAKKRIMELKAKKEKNKEQKRNAEKMMKELERQREEAEREEKRKKEEAEKRQKQEAEREARRKRTEELRRQEAEKRRKEKQEQEDKKKKAEQERLRKEREEKRKKEEELKRKKEKEEREAILEKLKKIKEEKEKLLKQTTFLNQESESLEKQKQEEEKRSNAKIDWENVEFQDKFKTSSSIFGNLDFKKKNLMETCVVFQEETEDGFDADIIHKNTHEVAEIYDDYDLHDVTFELKAVGLEKGQYFPSCQFPVGNDIKSAADILELTVDGKPEKIDFNDDCLTIHKELQNEQTAKVSYKYKAYPEGIKKKTHRQSFYGLWGHYPGQNAKYIVRVKGNWDILAVENDSFVKVGKNEYAWGGKIPEEGFNTRFTLSVPTAQYEIKLSQGIENAKGKENIHDTKLILPIQFFGGNVSIINLSNTCPAANEVVFGKNDYEIELKDTKTKRCIFTTKALVEVRTKGEWNVDLSDEEIEKKTIDKIGNDLGFFKQLAKQIVSQDTSDRPDYMKLCKWVYDNIKYDLAFSGKQKMKAKEIYDYKRGVCHHKTVLFNTLMYALGYQTIYVGGYANEKGVPGPHAWSLAKIDGKWIPFEPTWGFWNGKIPACHLYSSYNNRAKTFSARMSGLDWVKENLSIKLVKC